MSSVAATCVAVPYPPRYELVLRDWADARSPQAVTTSDTASAVTHKVRNFIPESPLTRHAGCRHSRSAAYTAATEVDQQQSECNAIVAPATPPPDR